MKRRVGLVFVLGLASCFSPIDLADRPCPCLSGWVCSPLSQLCVPAGVDPGIPTQMVLLAGQPGGTGNVDGVGVDSAAAPRFTTPTGLALDGRQLFVADLNDDLLRRLDLDTEQVTTILGMPGQSGLMDSPNVLIDGPSGLWLDNTTLYFTQFHAVRTRDANGVVSTVAGGRTAGYANAQGSAAHFNSPADITSDGQGNFYIADTGNDCIRVMDENGNVDVLAGTHGMQGSSNTPPLFNAPSGLAWGDGVLYVADEGNLTIRAITIGPPVSVTTIAGTAGQGGENDAMGTDASFMSPHGLAYDSAHRKLYIAEHYKLRVLDLNNNNLVTSIAGQPTPNGQFDGINNSATFVDLERLVFVPPSTLYVSDSSTIRTVDTMSQLVTTIAGRSEHFGDTDGPALQGLLDAPTGITHDDVGNIYFVDGPGNGRVRKLSKDGVLSTLGTPPAFKVMRPPTRIAFDPLSHSLFVTNGYEIDLMSVDDGSLTAFVGDRTTCDTTDGVGAAARFCAMQALVADGKGKLFVADSIQATRLRAIDIGSRAVTTIAGGCGGSVDGDGTVACLSNVNAMASDGAGTLYVTQDVYAASGVRKVVVGEDRASTTVLLWAGSVRGWIDGTGTDAHFADPEQLVYEPEYHRLYVADHDNSLVRTINTDTAEVKTIAGVPHIWDLERGPLPASLNRPLGLALVPGRGQVVGFVADNVLVVLQ
jgi:DNA-binding beta-propeller fold protein YncE